MAIYQTRGMLNVITKKTFQARRTIISFLITSPPAVRGSWRSQSKTFHDIGWKTKTKTKTCNVRSLSSTPRTVLQWNHRVRSHTGRTSINSMTAATTTLHITQHHVTGTDRALTHPTRSPIYKGWCHLDRFLLIQDTGQEAEDNSSSTPCSLRLRFVLREQYTRKKASKRRFRFGDNERERRSESEQSVMAWHY